MFVIDSLSKLCVLDDVTITAEERFRCRQCSSMSCEDPRDVAALTVTFPPMSNLPPPPLHPLADVRSFFLLFVFLCKDLFRTIGRFAKIVINYDSIGLTRVTKLSMFLFLTIKCPISIVIFLRQSNLRGQNTNLNWTSLHIRSVSS